MSVVLASKFCKHHSPVTLYVKSCKRVSDFNGSGGGKVSNPKHLSLFLSIRTGYLHSHSCILRRRTAGATGHATTGLALLGLQRNLQVLVKVLGFPSSHGSLRAADATDETPRPSAASRRPEPRSGSLGYGLEICQALQYAMLLRRLCSISFSPYNRNKFAG